MKKDNREIWICESGDVFTTEIHCDKRKHLDDRKKRHHKKRYYMIPISVFVIVITMFGKGVIKESKETFYYVVKQNDTLWDISRRYLGKGYKYIQIVIENDIDNPDLIYPNEEYRITVTHRIEVNN
jgi:hypothetical protein